VADERRHDLDALRAAAMLLGVVYHASLSFSRWQPWVVVDSDRSVIPYLWVSALHGFRMPLFFLISGFFVAMLWRRRGLAAPVRHRFRRVLLPCMVGLVTIVPISFVALVTAPPSYFLSRDGMAPERQEDAVWRAVRWGDANAVEAYLAAGGDPSVTERELGASLMTLAAYAGQFGIVEALIDHGVDVNSRDRHGNTAMHAAAYVGHYGIFSLLAQHDADRSTANRGGRRPVDMAGVSWPVTDLVAKWMNIPLQEEAVIAGKKRISGELGRAPDPEDKTLLAVLWEQANDAPIFLHLWFLWYLWWYTAIFAACAFAGARLNLKFSLPSNVMLSPAFLLVLVPLTALPGWFMHEFGADTSITVIPDPEVFAFYGLFFVFGALYYECRDTAARLGRRWPLLLAIGLVVVFPPAIDMATGIFGVVDDVLDVSVQRIIGVSLEAAFAWVMVFCFMGMARALLKRERPFVRYLSDSAYWLYLAHLPLVIFAQSIVARWDLPWPVKLALVLGSVLTILLVSYRYLVRYTFVGAFLNGPRSRAGRSAGAQSPA